MNRAIVLLLFFLTPISSLCFAADQLKIGFIGGLSGPGKVYGEAYKNRFRNTDMLSGAAVHYDIAKFILPKTLGLKSKKEILEAVVNTNFVDAALGNYKIKKTDDDQFFDFNLAVKYHNDGKIERHQ